VPRALQEVVFVDGVRTPFGKAGGLYAETRADDLVIRCIRELLRRNPQLPPERVDEVAIAATTQIGDQGLTIGRTAALLSGLPKSVPGYSIDRMCAGAMTAVTNVAGGIAMGAYDVAIAGGVEHMGRHPMGEGVDPNPRILAEKLVDPSALVMGATAEKLAVDLRITREEQDAFAVFSCEARPNASTRSLVMFGRRSCRFSAVEPITSADGSTSFSARIRGLGSTPSPIGCRPMCSTPPAMATS